MQSNPRKTEIDMIAEEVHSEVVLYDKQRNRAHCLNRTAAFVREQCDGNTPVGEIVARAQAQLELPEAEGVVMLTLKGLSKAGLIEGDLALDANGSGFTRREVARKVLLVGASPLVLPFVSSILAPTAARAKSKDNGNKNKKKKKNG
jgi:Coenzyme PQQ synthesis protein D (PqqD)